MREGMIPTILGTGVTATGVALKGMSMKNRQDNNDLMPMIAAGIIGFGLAHIVLGTIDLVEDNG
ncbi:asparagine synthase [Alkaliphilus pronyensis]|uniref:Asparagine synthase n=1 Tax=Alkaliphilus pronyensis TaxID=1482732 RepID=A0A6I0EZF0_9FIRM|nr:asparagine synthase [Alkaliphilus pronyensis]KAB3535338.1 asparagine synthase [Alkaliphilus pronyensis]